MRNWTSLASLVQKRKVRLILSYAFDYALITTLAILYAFLDRIITPYAQHFSMNDIALQNPKADPEKVPMSMAVVYSSLCPAAIIFLYTLAIDGNFNYSQRRNAREDQISWHDRLWQLNCGILGLFLAQGSAFVITGSLKNLIGKPRPDLLYRCQLSRTVLEAGDSPGPNFGLLSRANCTQEDPYILQDGFRSFPSGHASAAFAGLFYLSLYLAAKLHVLDQRGEIWRTVAVIIPTLSAAMIAGSRLVDARHHPIDVYLGSALGILCAWGSYRQYFPPLSHTWEKGRAYPVRSWGATQYDTDDVEGLHERLNDNNFRTEGMPATPSHHLHRRIDDQIGVELVDGPDKALDHQKTRVIV